MAGVEAVIPAVEEEVGLGWKPREQVAGVPVWDVWQKGICVCGHRMSKHRGPDGDRGCGGVPVGRRRYVTQEETDCSCRGAVAVMVVTDVRPFQVSWASSYPMHPFDRALIKLREQGGSETWLIETPLSCAVCGAVGGVRMAYQPGTRRMVSGLACQDCVVQENQP